MLETSRQQSYVFFWKDDLPFRKKVRDGPAQQRAEYGQDLSFCRPAIEASLGLFGEKSGRVYRLSASRNDYHLAACELGCSVSLNGDIAVRCGLDRTRPDMRAANWPNAFISISRCVGVPRRSSQAIGDFHAVS